jgi:hypothetical protein
VYNAALALNYMRQAFLAFLVLTLIPQTATAQGSNNGIWTSPGYNVQNVPSGRDAGIPSGAGNWGSAARMTGSALQVKTAPAPSVNAVDIVYDNEQGIEMLRISGTNLGSYKERIHITMGGAKVNVLRCDPKLIAAELPPGAASPSLVSIKINGQVVLKDKKIELPPRVTGVSLLSGPPGTPITIYGTHFAQKLTDNTVFIGSVEVPINGGSTTELSVVISGALNMQLTGGVPIVVKVGQLTSNSNVGIRIQNRMY